MGLLSPRGSAHNLRDRTVLDMIRKFLSLGAMLVAGALPAQAAPEDLRVQIVPVVERPLRLALELSGTLQAHNSVELGFRQSGRVQQVLVEEGDTVRRDQEIARLDSVQQDQALSVAKASLSAALATRKQASQASDRAAAMLTRGVGTRAARDDAVRALSQAEGAVERAQSNLEQAQRAVEDTVLRAPGDAIVTARAMAAGQIVGAAQPVVSLAELGPMEAVFAAPDHPLLTAMRGNDVHMTALDIDLPEMIGTVTEIAPLVDPGTGTVTVRAELQKTPVTAQLLGAAVRGRLMVTVDQALTVPWTALARAKGRPAVWVVGEDGRVTLSPIKIRYFGDGEVFVQDGLVSGQKVVGAGSQLLFPGRRVQPVDTGEGARQ